MGQQRLESLVEAEGGLLSATELGRRLGITPQAVNQRRRKGLLLGLLQGRSVRYPTWQVDEAGQVLTGLELVLEALRSQPPAMVLQFLLRPHAALGNRRPLDVLRAGVVEPVIEAASGLGEHGAF